MCLDSAQASGSLQLLFWGTQGLTAGELSCTTWRMGGFAGSEGCGPVILGKTLVVWRGFQERWWDGVLAGKWQQGEGCCTWDRRGVLVLIMLRSSENEHLETVTF